MASKKSTTSKKSTPQIAEYRHNEQAIARPDVGVQPQFKRRAAPKTYRYDSCLSPALDWGGQNPAREQGEAVIAQLEAQLATLRALGVPSILGEERWRDEAIAAYKTALAELEERLRALKALSRPFLNPAPYVQATLDLMMGDLLKNMRSSQIFSVCGLPEIALKVIDDRGNELMVVQHVGR